jgi:small subunit ribosomal protein S13
MFNKSNKILTNMVKEYGVGCFVKIKLFKKTGLNTRRNILNCKYSAINKLERLRKNIYFSKTLLFQNKKRKNYLIKLNNFRGLRHQLKKPVRGQRTKTNAKTARKLNLVNEKKKKT